MSAECQELNYLFSMSVDGNRIRIPKHLETPPKPGNESFILDILHEAASKYVVAYRSRTPQWDGFTFDAMQLLLSREDFALKEFELVKLTYRWCLRNQTRLVDFMDYFDFDRMSDEEKAWVLGQIPSSIERPSLVLNALLSSNLVCTVRFFSFLKRSILVHQCIFQ